MAPNLIGSWREEFSIREADFTAWRFVVNFHGEEFTLEGKNDRLNVYRASDEEPTGFVRRGSPQSGAIWNSGECIADYEAEQDGTYHVTEIKEDFRHPETQVLADPVLFLLSALTTADDLLPTKERVQTR